MNKHFKLGASLLVAAGTFGIVGAAPANAAACPSGTPTFNSLPLPPAFTCEQGNFRITLNTKEVFADLDGISFSNPTVDSFQYSLNNNVVWAPAAERTLNFTVESLTPKVLGGFSTGLSSSNGDGAATWSVQSDAQPAAMATTTLTAGLNTSGGTSTLNPKLTTATFTAKLNVTAGDVSSTTFRINAVNAPTSAVPGPLPILGAGAAFGFSRRLRNRIKHLS